MSLPTNKDDRKARPIARGVLDYFPDAIAAVANLSHVGNEQHNPGEPMHWARGKSNDHADCVVRHLIDRGKIDTDGVRHSAKVAWRALALLQLEIEAEQGGPPHVESPAKPTHTSGSLYYRVDSSGNIWFTSDMKEWNISMRFKTKKQFHDSIDCGVLVSLL